MTTPARTRRLTPTNFRSYHAATLPVGDGPVVLVGPNGAGKTNLLEAISFLAPGRGLRRATLDDVAFSEGAGSWAGAGARVGGGRGWGGCPSPWRRWARGSTRRPLRRRSPPANIGLTASRSRQ